MTRDLEAKREEAEKELAAYLARGRFVSLGPVGQGNIVGRVGNTGFSSGPHLHLEIRDPNGNPVNPGNFYAAGWIRPVDSYVTQGYGNPSPRYYRGYHAGIDYGGAGLPVSAVASGSVIHRGCSSSSPIFNYSPAYGYSVVIQHANGYFSIYGHMTPPSSGYDACSYSYF